VIEMNYGRAGARVDARAPATASHRSSKPWRIVIMGQGVTIAPARTPECSQLIHWICTTSRLTEL
jgi:hypothetical protein